MTDKKKREPLVFQILTLCGVRDHEGINCVDIHIQPRDFRVEVTYNSKSPDGKPYMLEDQAVVTHMKRFKLVEEK